MQLKEKYVVDNQGNKIAVMLEIQEYERLLDLENELLALKAEKAKKQGFIGISESETLLSNILNAED